MPATKLGLSSVQYAIEKISESLHEEFCLKHAVMFCKLLLLTTVPHSEELHQFLRTVGTRLEAREAPEGNHILRGSGGKPCFEGTQLCFSLGCFSSAFSALGLVASWLLGSSLT